MGLTDDFYVKRGLKFLSSERGALDNFRDDFFIASTPPLTGVCEQSLRLHRPICSKTGNKSENCQNHPFWG